MPTKAPARIAFIAGLIAVVGAVVVYVVQPLWGVLNEYFMFNPKTITWIDLAFGTIIVGGVWLVVRNKDEEVGNAPVGVMLGGQVLGFVIMAFRRAFGD